MKEKKIDRGILALIIGIAVLAVLFSGWRNLRKGVYLGNDFFYRAGDCLYQKNSVNYIRSVPEDGSIGFTISLNGKEQSASLTRQEDFVSITYDDGTVIEGIWNGQWFSDRETGFPLEFGADNITITVGNQPFQPGKPAISNALCRIAWGGLERKGSMILLCFGGFLYALGAAAFLFPNEAHFFLRRWAYQNAELSESGLLMEKAGGVIVMVVGIVVMLGLFIV
jgi:hypothetical protein